MKNLLLLAARIDRLSEATSNVARWALLLNALVVASNAVMRTFFSIALPSAFDLQWHFFAAVVLLMAAETLRRDEHVRIDVFANRFGERGLAWLDLVGIVAVLMPVCLAMVWIGGGDFLRSFLSGESRATRESVSALPAWIIKGFVPAGFLLLAIQGFAEVIRCVALLRGVARRKAFGRGAIDDH